MSECPESFYSVLFQSEESDGARRGVCVPCHPYCRSCVGPSERNCTACTDPDYSERKWRYFESARGSTSNSATASSAKSSPRSTTGTGSTRNSPTRRASNSSRRARYPQSDLTERLPLAFTPSSRHYCVFSCHPTCPEALRASPLLPHGFPRPPNASPGAAQFRASSAAPTLAARRATAAQAGLPSPFVASVMSLLSRALHVASSALAILVPSVALNN